jgi:hypothetical protein
MHLFIYLLFIYLFMYVSSYLYEQHIRCSDMGLWAEIPVIPT